jgi:transcriptional regulator with XRE-family HTH domain
MLLLFLLPEVVCSGKLSLMHPKRTSETMSHPVDLYVGKRLKQCRVSVGMSQTDLAEAVGITFQQIQKYERGTNRMSASRLYEFACVLGIKVNYFFDGFEANNSDLHLLSPHGMEDEGVAFLAESLQDSRESLEFVRSFQRIRDTKQRKALSAFVRSLADGTPTMQE